MFGNTGKIVEVNLTTGAVERKTLPEEYYKKYIGGSGLAAKLFWDRGDFTSDPLAPEATLTFMNGPFAGLKMAGASRNSVTGRSPLTGVWGDSSCGGYFAPELRYAVSCLISTVLPLTSNSLSERVNRFSAMPPSSVR